MGVFRGTKLPAAYGAIRDAGAVLLDHGSTSEALPKDIREAIESDGDTISDLHVWQLGPGHHGAIISIQSGSLQEPATYRNKLAHIHDLSHVTIEVERVASTEPAAAII